MSRPGGRAVAALLLLLAAGCSGGDPTVEAAPDSTTTTSTTATTTSTTAVPATTSTTTGPACPAAPSVSDGTVGGTLVGEPTPVVATIDGGAADDLVSTELGEGGWHVVVRLADGGAIDELLPSAAADSVRVRSAIDIDADGTDELWVQVGTGASVDIVGLYDLDGCDIEPVLIEGVPAQFSVGGTVLLLQGLACGESDVTHLGATSEDGVTYAALDLTYELEGGSLVRIGDENEVEDLRGTSVVTTGYGPGNTVVGGLGVLGPTRMDYPGTIATVRAVARYVGEVLAQN